MVDAGLIADIRAIVGDAGIVTGDSVRERADVMGHHMQATTLVRPASTEEVSAVLALCHARRQVVVPHGGRTGLVEGTSTTAGDLILSTERLTRIEYTDAPGRTMRVQAGVTLQNVQEEADRHGLLFPLDLGGRGSCTIGGNIATNAGGVRVLRYGMMRALVLGLEVVLADGTVLKSLNRMLKNNAGYDLKQMFIGSEGTLGVITRADLRVFAKPRSTSTAFVACPDFEHFVKLLGVLDSRLGGTLSVFEAMWPEFYEGTTSKATPNTPLLPYGHGMYGLIETQGSEPGADEERLERVLGDAFEEGLVVDAIVAKSEAETRAIWAAREDPWLIGQQHGATLNFDVSVAIGQMEAYLEKLRAAATQRVPGAKVFRFGHIADGNLHVIVAPGRDDAATLHDLEALVYGLLREFDGSISAEHGVGIERRHFLGITRTDHEIAAMRAVKATLDPHGILNPGKMFE